MKYAILIPPFVTSNAQAAFVAKLQSEGATRSTIMRQAIKALGDNPDVSYDSNGKSFSAMVNAFRVTEEQNEFLKEQEKTRNGSRSQVLRDALAALAQEIKKEGE